MTLKKIVVDCSTGITEEIDMTAEEVAQFEADQAQAQADQVARDAETARIQALKDSAKAKLVAGEKLSADEAALLIG